MDRIISQITSAISSIQSLFYRVEDSTRRSSRFVSWIRSFNWWETEDEEDEETDENKPLKSGK